jgi:predicted transcriptional regulator
MRRERLSKQLLRVVSILEIISRLENADISTITRILNQASGFSVCNRTTSRDLFTLETAGFISSRKIPLAAGGSRKSFQIESPERIAKICQAEKERRRTIDVPA